jgi:hypothetical protein
MLRRNNMKKSVGLILIGCGLLAGSLTGCSNKPSDEEMKNQYPMRKFKKPHCCVLLQRKMHS